MLRFFELRLPKNSSLYTAFGVVLKIIKVANFSELATFSF